MATPTIGRGQRGARFLVAGLASTLMIAWLGGCAPAPAPAPTPLPTGAPTATATGAATPTTEPTSSQPLSPVDLSAEGIGTVLIGTPDALPILETLLGPPDSTDGSLADCGAPSITFAKWGSLWVSLEDGALFGWQLNGTQRPAAVALPYGIDIGAPYSEVAALPGAGNPEHLDNYQVYEVTIDGVTWWFGGIEADSPVTMIGHGILGCG